MEQAIEAVEHGESIRRAAEMYDVPWATLHDYISGVQYGSRPGPKAYLTSEEEEELSSWLCKDWIPPHQKQVFGLVQQIVNDKGIKTTVTNGWWERFCGRDPQVTLCSVVPLSYTRAMASDRTVIENYYDTLEDTLRRMLFLTSQQL